jgi:hypothetical protein
MTTTGPHRGIILSADDFALAPGVSRGICALAEASRISATSCMTQSPFWPEHAGRLRPVADRIDVGIHFTLTDQRPLGPMPALAPQGRLPSLARLMRAAFARRLDPGEIAAELERQLDAFVSALGRPPAFLDGHQHVHQLPVVREALVALWRRRLADAGTALRICDEPLGRVLRRRAAAKAALVSVLGRGLRGHASRHGIPANAGFAGIHDFRLRIDYRSLFLDFVRLGPPRLLVMCHPGFADAELAAVDPVTTAREAEFRYFASDAFAADLDRLRLALVRWDGAAVSPRAVPGTSSAPG